MFPRVTLRTTDSTRGRESPPVYAGGRKLADPDGDRSAAAARLAKTTTPAWTAAVDTRLRFSATTPAISQSRTSPTLPSAFRSSSAPTERLPEQSAPAGDDVEFVASKTY